MKMNCQPEGCTVPLSTMSIAVMLTQSTIGMKRSSKMAPHNHDYHNDPTFQCLLSSQREHLSRLNSLHNIGQRVHRDIDVTRSHGGWAEPMNESIGFETFRNDMLAPSRRLSMGIGADDLILADQKVESDFFTVSLFDDVAKKVIEDSHHEPTIKRRRSFLSYLNELFEHDSELGMPPIPARKRSRNRVEYNDSDDEDYGVIVEDASSDEDSEDQQNCPLPTMNPADVKQSLVTFDETMRRSQDSQQQIHDWDRKMGLKRSHSKTMRLSSRSRKQLRQFTQKDIINISKWA